MICQESPLLTAEHRSNACAPVHDNHEAAAWSRWLWSAKVDEQPFRLATATLISECVQRIAIQIEALPNCCLATDRQALCLANQRCMSRKRRSATERTHQRKHDRCDSPSSPTVRGHARFLWVREHCRLKQKCSLTLKLRNRNASLSFNLVPPAWSPAVESGLDCYFLLHVSLTPSLGCTSAGMPTSSYRIRRSCGHVP